MANKVMKINLESNMPTVDAALQRLRNEIQSCRGMGCKAMVVIHGYGSSGTGGKIRPAVLKMLGDPSMRGLVKAFAPGEQWHLRKREFLAICGTLEEYQREIDDNFGVTVVILK
jgi:hypothetical protein